MAPSQWYYLKGGQRVGPVSDSQLKQLAASGGLGGDDLVWKEGLPAWQPLRRMEGLYAPPPPPAAPHAATTPPPMKSAEPVLATAGAAPPAGPPPLKPPAPSVAVAPPPRPPVDDVPTSSESAGPATGQGWLDKAKNLVTAARDKIDPTRNAAPAAPPPVDRPPRLDDAKRLLIQGTEALDRGEDDSALDAFRLAIQDDTRLVPEVLEKLRSLSSQRELGAALADWQRDLEARASDRTQGWYVRDPRGPNTVNGPSSLQDVLALRRQGRLYDDEAIKHFGDSRWEPVALCPDLQGSPLTGFRDTGSFAAGIFAKAREAVLATCADRELVFFGSIDSVEKPGVNKTVYHLALTPTHVAVVSPEAGKLKVDRASWEAATWLLKPQPGGDASLNLVTQQASYEMTVRPGRGLEILLERSRQVFLDRAHANAAEEKNYWTEKLLLQRGENDSDGKGKELKEKLGTIGQVITSYVGGHPAHTEKVLGCLRLDRGGLEFTSMLPGSDTYFRIPYDRILDILPPQRGELPEDVAQDVSQKQSKGAMLRTGLGVMASTVIPGGWMLVNGLGSALSKNKPGQSPIPSNRLCAIVQFEGTQYKLFFDVVAGGRDDLDRQASEFWNKAAQVRSRFLKPNAAPAARRAPAPSADLDQQLRVLGEIRDLLRKVVPFIELRELRSLLQEGTLNEEEFQRRKRDLLSVAPPPPPADETPPETQAATNVQTSTESSAPETPSPPPVQRKEKVVVGCPRCETKLRAAKPGVVGCPKCQTKIRVAPALFVVSPQPAGADVEES